MTTPPRWVAWAVLGLVAAVAVALSLLFTSPAIDCSTGTCDPPSLQERIAMPLAVACAGAVLALAFVPAARAWRGWFLAAAIPLVLIGLFWIADAAGASLDGFDRPVFGPDEPCDDTGDGSSAKCAGDPFTWGTILLLGGYGGLACLGVLAGKSLRLLARRQSSAKP